jgi:hypothetical protein
MSSEREVRVIFGMGVVPEGMPADQADPFQAGILWAAMAEELIRAHEHGRVSVAMGRASDFYAPGATESSLGSIIFGSLL